MTRMALAFLSGALVVACAVVYAGGTGARMFVSGGIVAACGLVGVLAAVGARRAGTFLLAFADALEAVKTPKAGRVQSSGHSGPATAGDQNSGQAAEIKAALVRLGSKPGRAQMIADQVTAKGGDFEAMLRSAINTATGRAAA